MAVYRLGTFAVLFVLAAPLLAEDSIDLGVTRVALFSSGVAYFEREAEVSGDVTAELKFRTDQINDIIKSMIVQDFGGGNVGVISYASRDPIEKTLRSFGVDLTGKPTLGQLLDQLRGEPVEIAGGRSLSGIIVGVEKVPVYDPQGKTVEQIERLTLLTPDGLQQLPLAELSGIRLTNAKVDAELRKALATLATAHGADKKSVALQFEGMGQRKVRVAYLLEAPIWKTSYRLALTDDEKPFLQGWATVENATEEDWDNVRLSLVSGRPISFQMDLYTPLYVPRPVEQLELYASLRPPDYDAGFDQEERVESRRMAGRPARGGVMRGRMKVTDAAPAFAGGAVLGQPAEEARVALYGTGVESIAAAREAGELFEYSIATPVSIPRQHSAMLPIVNQAVEAEKISIFNPATHPKHPLNGLELKNTTGLNLMQGPATVFDGNMYAGDAKLPDLKPDEKRLIAYALDLGTEVMIKRQPQPDKLVRMWIKKGTLWLRHEYRDEREYVIKNKLDRQRQVLLEQPVSSDWKLVEPQKPYERTANLLRFKVAVAPKQTRTYPVRLERLGDQSIALFNVGLDRIQYYLRARVISPEVQAAMEKIVALRTELDKLRRQRERLEGEREEAVADQARVRENLKTLDRNTDAYQRQLKIFDEVDARITDLARQIKDARDREQQQRRTLDEYLLSLDIE